MNKKYKIKVSGKVYEVEVEEMTSASTNIPAQAPVTAQTPQPVVVATPSAPPPVATPPPSSAQAEMTAPIPGSIFKIHASPGDSVKSGDLLLVIEAMKMENEITAEFDGTIADIPVKEGDNVSAGDVIVRFS